MLTAYLNVFVIFLLIFVGYLLTWYTWFDNKIVDTFSKLVLNLSLPLSMFLNITKQFSRSEFLLLGKGMLLPLFSIIFTFLISMIYTKLTKVNKKHIGSFQTMFTASNTIFMGLPINLAIFGEKAIPFVLLYYICNTTFFWTAGVFLLAIDNPAAELNQVRFHPMTALKKIVSPALLGFIIGIICLLLGIPRVHFLESFFKYLGDLTTPLSMFVIGAIIYQTGIKNLKLTKDVIGVLIGRYLISPIAVVGLSYFIHIPDLMLKVFIIQSAMPVQNSVPILTRNYNGDTAFAATTLSYSVLTYLLVIPILLLLIFR